MNTSFSTQPPDTDPSMSPADETRNRLPSGLGAGPLTRTNVATATAFPSDLQRLATSMLGANSTVSSFEEVFGHVIPLEMAAIGVGPATSPSEAPLLEDRRDVGIHSDTTAVGVVAGVDIDGNSPCVP